MYKGNAFQLKIRLCQVSRESITEEKLIHIECVCTEIRKKQMNGILKINEEGDLEDESSDLLTKRKL